MQDNYHVGTSATSTSLEEFGTNKLAYLIFILFLELVLSMLILSRWYLLCS